MQRTDSEILQWVTRLFTPAGDEDLKLDALERIEGAFSCGLTGRAALEAAIGAELLEPGDPMPVLTGVQRIAIEVEQGDAVLRDASWDEESIETLVQRGAALAIEIDRKLDQRISGTVTITAEPTIDIELTPGGTVAEPFESGL